MIDRYTLINFSFVSNSFEIDIDNIKPNYNANPTQKLPIITFDKNKKVSYVYWGSTKEMTKNNPPAVRLINVELSKLKKSNILLNTFKYINYLRISEHFPKVGPQGIAKRFFMYNS